MATTLAKLAIVMLADTKGLRAGFNQAKGEVRGFNGQIAPSVSMLGAMAGAFKVAAIVGGFAAATAAAKKFLEVGISTRAMLEQLSISFEVMTGSADIAKDLLADLRKLSLETPFEMQGLQQAAKTLMAMGEPTEAIIADLKMLGDVAAASGQPINELAQVFGQVMQAGRLTGNELRQFNERGIPLLSELAEQMGVSKAAIRAMVEDAQISSRDVIEAFQAMTAEGGRFENMMERQTDTLTGQWNKFKENMTMTSADSMGSLPFILKMSFMGLNAELDKFNQKAPSALDKWKAFLSLGMIMPEMPAPEMSGFKTINQEVADELRDRAVAIANLEKATAALAKEQRAAAEAAKSQAESIAKSLREPEEVFRDSIKELMALTDQGLLSWENFERGVGRAADALDIATKKATEFKNAGKITVGAAERFTMAGQSALIQGTIETRKREAEAKKAEAQRDKTNKLLDDILKETEAKEPLVIKKVDLGAM